MGNSAENVAGAYRHPRPVRIAEGNGARRRVSYIVRNTRDTSSPAVATGLVGIVSEDSPNFSILLLSITLRPDEAGVSCPRKGPRICYALWPSRDAAAVAQHRPFAAQVHSSGLLAVRKIHGMRVCLFTERPPGAQLTGMREGKRRCLRHGFACWNVCNRWVSDEESQGEPAFGLAVRCRGIFLHVHWPFQDHRMQSSSGYSAR